MSRLNTQKPCASLALVPPMLAVLLTLAGCTEVNKSDWQNMDYTNRSVKSGVHSEIID